MSIVRLTLTVLLAALLRPVATGAEPIAIKLTVHGDGIARDNAPVTARIDTKLPVTGVAAATLTTDDGFQVPAQIEKRAGDATIVRWVEPSLSADVPKTYVLTVDP